MEIVIVIVSIKDITIFGVYWFIIARRVRGIISVITGIYDSCRPTFNEISIIVNKIRKAWITISTGRAYIDFIIEKISVSYSIDIR